MRDEIFEDLNGGDPRLAFVGYSCFTTTSHDHLIVVHAIYQVPEGLREHFCVSVHLQ